MASVAGSQTVEPAIRSVWDIVAEGLRERGLFVLVIGLAFVGGGVLAGTRPFTPSPRDASSHRTCATIRSGSTLVVAVLFLVWLAFTPGIC